MTMARGSRSKMASLPRARARAAVYAGAAVVCLLCQLSGAPAAQASEASQILERCAHGQSLAGFSAAAYAKALRSVPTVLSEYSNCEELIRKAELAAAGGVGGSGNLGGGAGTPGGLPGSTITPPTPAEQATLARARSEGDAPVGLGGQTVNPGVVKVGIASAFSSLPDSLLALLALLLAMTLIGGARALAMRSGRLSGGLPTLHPPTRRQ